MSLVSAGDGPEIGITGPEDGEWYPYSEVLVEGWSAGQSYSGFINMTELGRGELESMAHNG
ncbi:MAG: hypothetical protein KAS77_07835, partial [Thermoplasmata archaeon]|nr:hypothetical protein [Thermoplasmata archaeon]